MSFKFAVLLGPIYGTEQQQAETLFRLFPDNNRDYLVPISRNLEVHYPGLGGLVTSY